MDIHDVNCPNCGHQVPFHRRSCHVCEQDIGFPNVRFAENEISHLQKRYDSANEAAKTKNCEEALKKFKCSLNDSNVIIARSLLKVFDLIGSENQMLITFYNEVSGNARVASNNVWDKNRSSADNAIHPLYVKDIHFAVLSLSDYGVKYYGNCHIKLKMNYIKERTSFFEENPFIFFKKHEKVTGESIPPGYRSDWDNRGKLAVAKLHSEISNDTKVSEYEGILIFDDDTDSDFIEAHIYGSIHPNLFESIRVSEPSNTEKALLNAYKSRFDHYKIEVTVEG